MNYHDSVLRNPPTPAEKKKAMKIKLKHVLIALGSTVVAIAFAGKFGQ